LLLTAILACHQAKHVSGAENGVERAENRVSGSGAVSGHYRKETLEWERIVELDAVQRKRSGEYG